MARMTAAKHLLRYLKGLPDLAVTYEKGQFTINGYVDASFSAGPDNRKSTTGYLFLMSGGPLSFGAKTQIDCTINGEIGADGHRLRVKGGRVPLRLHDRAGIQNIQLCADQL